jgi:hypothetical protein
MPFSPDSSTTGGTQTGLTSPTYTLVADTVQNGQKQWAVSALGGTQTNVRANTISDPFTATFFKPAAPKALPAANPVTGKYSAIPVNTYGLLIRKGVRVDAAGVQSVARVRVNFDIPAGADASDAINIRAMISFLVGLLNEESDDLSDTLLTGVL